MGVIYSITFTGASGLYIGSARNLRARMHAHLHLLRQGRHHSIILQRAFDKYGHRNIVVSVLETVEDDGTLITREQFWIDRFNGRLYNRQERAASRMGMRSTLQTRQKISASLIGNKHRLGIPHSAEDRRKIGDGVRRANAEGRRRIPKGNPNHFLKVLEDWRTGARRHPRALSDERIRAILTSLYETGSLEETAAAFGICKASVWYAGKQFRVRLDDAIEAATGIRPTGRYRSTAIHPEWLDMAM